MHVAVNRVLSERLGRPGEPECEKPFLPDQAITLDAAIDAFTTGVAWVNHEEDVAGRLLPGMRADLAVLDQDLYAIPRPRHRQHLGRDDGRGRNRRARRPLGALGALLRGRAVRGDEGVSQRSFRRKENSPGGRVTCRPGCAVLVA